MDFLRAQITHPSITGINPGLPYDSIRKTMRIADVHVVYDSRRLFAFLVEKSFLWLGLQLITSVGICISCLELKSRRLVSRSEFSLEYNFIKYANGEINRQGWSGTWDEWNGMMAQATIMCMIHTRVAAWSALCRLFTSQSLDSFFEVFYCGEEISSIEAWTKRVRLVVKFSLRTCPSAQKHRLNKSTPEGRAITRLRRSCRAAHSIDEPRSWTLVKGRPIHRVRLVPLASFFAGDAYRTALSRPIFHHTNPRSLRACIKSSVPVTYPRCWWRFLKASAPMLQAAWYTKQKLASGTPYTGAWVRSRLCSSRRSRFRRSWTPLDGRLCDTNITTIIS